MGEDSARDFKSWKNWQQIIDYCNLLVARRPNTDNFDLDSDLSPSLYYIEHHPVEISSTKVRNQITKQQDITELVPSTVATFIQENNLYQN
jgi:nicotinate-nucleotide adenylyltransferase